MILNTWLPISYLPLLEHDGSKTIISTSSNVSSGKVVKSWFRTSTHDADSSSMRCFRTLNRLESFSMAISVLKIRIGWKKYKRGHLPSLNAITNQKSISAYLDERHQWNEFLTLHFAFGQLCMKFCYQGQHSRLWPSFLAARHSKRLANS